MIDEHCTANISLPRYIISIPKFYFVSKVQNTLKTCINSEFGNNKLT